MRIISNFKDYYDHYQSSDDAYYVRDTRWLNESVPGLYGPVDFHFRDWTWRKASSKSRWNHGTGSHFRKNNVKFTFRPIHGYFCGKYYFGVAMDGDFQGTIYTQFFWDQYKFEQRLEELGKESIRYKWHHLNHAPSHIDQWKAEAKPETVEWMIKNKVTSLFSIRKFDTDAFVWEVEPCLIDYHFYQKLDMQQTFQEIEMWVTGALSQKGSPPLVTLSDKSLIAKHGYDKWSFRRPPE